MPERSQFAAFLRSRREKVAPEDVGLPAAGRRRTPGLRREELAALAGISVDYLVRLEQGREINPSAAVLDALARTLQLSLDEARHLHALAKEPQCATFCPSPAVETEVDDTVLALLDQLDGMPAVVLNRLSDLLTWNEAYERVMAATGLFDVMPPNLLRYTFLARQSREVYRDWEAVARAQVGNLRSATAKPQEDEPLTVLVGELSVQSTDFARLWAQHDVGDNVRGIEELQHPVVGELRMAFTGLKLPDRSTHLVVYAPADDATRTGVGRLLADTETGVQDGTRSAPQLRVVGANPPPGAHPAAL